MAYNLNDFQANEICEAADYAQEKAADYIQGKDESATVDVYGGQVYVKWSGEDDNFPSEEKSAQEVFDLYFEERLADISLNKKEAN